MKNHLGDKCFCDTFTVSNGCLLAEVDGVSFDSNEYNDYAEFMQAIINRVYDCAMGKLN
jgi:hypothetical protein